LYPLNNFILLDLDKVNLLWGVLLTDIFSLFFMESIVFLSLGLLLLFIIF
jgi:hypothetical protein